MPPTPHTIPLPFRGAGPNTIVGLSKQAEGVSFDASQAVAALLPAYSQLLQSLKALGVPEVQVHEPILTTHRAESLKSDFGATYGQLAKAGLPIDLVTYYDDVGEAYPWVVQLPVQVCLLRLYLHIQLPKTPIGSVNIALFSAPLGSHTRSCNPKSGSPCKTVPCGRSCSLP